MTTRSHSVGAALGAILSVLLSIPGCVLDDAGDAEPDDPDLGQADQELGSSPTAHTIGDFDDDGVPDTGRDAIAFLNAFDIQVLTYALTDDTRNPGWNL